MARALAREGVGPADPHSHHGRSKTTQAVARDPAVTAEQEGNAARAAEQAALQAKERREELKVRKDKDLQELQAWPSQASAEVGSALCLSDKLACSEAAAAVNGSDSDDSNSDL